MADSKYNWDTLYPALEHFAEARHVSLKAGFTDNGGAIHSVERILDILGHRLCYPDSGAGLDTFKKYPDAPRTEAAHKAIQEGLPVRIEHIAPQRAFARAVCDMIDANEPKEHIKKYIKETYRLALLTVEEAKALDKKNRSNIAHNRLEDAGLKLIYPNPKVE